MEKDSKHPPTKKPKEKQRVVESEKEVTILPIIDLLKRELEDLLKRIITRYINVSEATKQFRQEPTFASLIIEHCLNTRSSRDGFIREMKSFLKRHYQIHFHFFREYYADRGSALESFIDDYHAIPPGVIRNIHRLDLEVDKLIESDVKGIVSEIEKSRLRLYSPGENNRLLCFIDPDSVNVQIGDFEYKGIPFEREEMFIDNRETSLTKVSEYYHNTIVNKMLKKIDMNAKIVEEAALIHMAESDARIFQAQLETVKEDVRVKAMESLKNGELKDYAIAALVDAHEKNGVSEVAHILKDSPKALLAIDSELFNTHETARFKEMLLEITKENPSKIDPITMAMLFNNDFNDMVGSFIHKELNTILSDYFRKPRRIMDYGGGHHYLPDNESKRSKDES
jgi:hypothetical protein